jgi:hypothetical protein
VADYVEELMGDDRLIELYEYWREKKQQRSMPRRDEIDPSEISMLLPHIMLVDVVDGNEFRFRMVGTALDGVIGVNATGRKIDEVMAAGPYADYVLGIFREVLQQKVPLYAECEHGDLSVEPHATLRLVMPLSDDGENVTAALVGQVFDADDIDAVIKASDETGTFEEGVRVLLP